MRKKSKDNLKTSFSNVFAGRGSELNQLRGYFKLAAKGCGNFVVISGEAGIGKTTLVQNFTAEADEHDATIVTVNLSQFPSYEPYKPFLHLIEYLRESKKGKKFELMPENAETSAGSSIESLFSLQTNQALVQQRLVAKIIEAAKEKTLVISLIEAHTASLSTWKFIHYLCEAITDKRILLLATLRQDGKTKSPANAPVYADVLQRMNREGLLEKIQLDRFNEKETNEFLHEAFARRDFSGGFTSLFQEITGGIPQQVKKCLQKMVQAGIVFQENGVWFDQKSVSKDVLFELATDQGDIEATRKVVAELSPNLKLIFKYSALMNGPFHHKILSVITHRSKISVIKDLMALKESSLLTSTEDDRYVIKRPANRSAILEEMTAEEKLNMHGVIATSIEADGQFDSTERIYRLAYHFSHTDNHYLAFKYLRHAGELATENFAFLEALDFFKQAFDLRSKIAESAHKDEIIQLLIWLAWLGRVIGTWEESIAHYNVALEMCGEQDTRLKNQILLQQGLAYFRLSDWENARTCIEGCLNDKQKLSKLDQAMANYGLGNINFELGEYETSCEFYEAALSVAESLEAKQLMANIFNNMGAIENIRGHRMRAIALYSKSVPIFKSLSDNFGLARVYNNIGMTHADENNWQHANEFYGQSLMFSDVMGLVPLKSITFLNRASALTHLKKLNEAREYNFKALRLLEPLKDELGLAEYHKIQGIIEREQKNWQEAGEHLQTALAKYKAAENKLGCAESQEQLALLAKAMNNQEEAISWFEKALASFKKLGLNERPKIIESQLHKLESQGNKVTEVVCNEKAVQ